ncbi:hypothetical protein [Priestia megaterium]|uniref:hypothetical protein n=1 Tax=Priestia megaterium TaxID=1404 RepID=UPI0032426E21
MKKDVFDIYIDEVVSGRFIDRPKKQFEELEVVATAYLELTNEKALRYGNEKILTDEEMIQKKIIEKRLELLERQLK